MLRSIWDFIFLSFEIKTERNVLHLFDVAIRQRGENNENTIYFRFAF